MATIDELRSLLAENEASRTALAAKLGPMKDAAQQAYDTARFFNPEGKQYSPSWAGSLNGQQFTDPYALYAAAQADFQQKADLRTQTAKEFNALFPIKASLEEQLATAVDLSTTIKSPEATNPSATDAVAAEKQATATIEGTPDVNAPVESAVTNSAAVGLLQKSGKPSAEPVKDTPAAPTFKGGTDHRVRLKVPVSYVSGIHTQGPNQTLFKSQGIIFPYTPTIGQEYTASYNALPVIHSNYAQQFYKNSSVGNISLSAKFTVQNEYEANVYFSIVHLLRALTKMRWGDDENAGSPPPVCRLFAYGNGIMNNVPVAIASFKLDLPDNIDYFVTKDLSSAPVLSTIGITLIPIYSRNEIQQFTVDKWLTGDLRNKGYL